MRMCCTQPARCYVPAIPRPSGRAKKTCLSVFLVPDLTPSALIWCVKGAYQAAASVCVIFSLVSVCITLALHYYTTNKHGVGTQRACAASVRQLLDCSSDHLVPSNLPPMVLATFCGKMHRPELQPLYGCCWEQLCHSPGTFGFSLAILFSCRARAPGRLHSRISMPLPAG